MENFKPKVSRITSINQNCCRNSPLLAGLSFLAMVHSVSSVKNSNICLLSQHFTVKITEYVVGGKLLVKFIIKLKLARLYYNFSSSGNQLAEFFIWHHLVCTFHFDADQVWKMNCSLVTLVTPQKRGSKLKKFQKFKMYFAVGRLKCKQRNVKKSTLEIGII